jgi:hypothetical protein
VNFEDRTVVALGDPATRAAVFDDDALASVIASAYDADALDMQPPFGAVFDEMRLGVAAPQLARASGAWGVVGGSERSEASFTISGLGPPLPRIDAVWRGAVVADVMRDAARIEDVDTAWPALGTIDADIEADLGALPQNLADLEDARRVRLLERLRSPLDQPARLDDADLDAMLATVGVATVGELLGSRDVVPGSVSITFSAAPAVRAPLALPVTAVVLVRDAGFAVADLLADTRQVTERMSSLAVERPVDPALGRRNAVIALWIVPATTFDDTDWPGGNSVARRTAAAEWLAEQGVALAVPP